MGSDDENSNTPPEIIAAARNVTTNLLPDKSRSKYEKEYSMFMEWCSTHNVKKYSENVLLTYFSEHAKLLKSSTMWSKYSMLRATLSAKHDIDIHKYKNLIAFLKKNSTGYKAKKSKTFTKEEVNKFLLEAPDEQFLMKKVILILGLAGACRRDELVKMCITDVEDKGSILIIKVPDTKTKNSRVFTLANNENTIDLLSIYRKYVSLRPGHTAVPVPQRLFLRYNNGKCTSQCVGMNVVGKTPSDIAKYLNLPESNSYTGHCFRRTSATLLVNGGGDILRLKRHGGWKSSTVAEGYVEENVTEKLITTQKIFAEQSHHVQIIESRTAEELTAVSDVASTSGIVVRNCENCQFHFNIYNK